MWRFFSQLRAWLPGLVRLTLHLLHLGWWCAAFWKVMLIPGTTMSKSVCRFNLFWIKNPIPPGMILVWNHQLKPLAWKTQIWVNWTTFFFWGFLCLEFVGSQVKLVQGTADRTLCWGNPSDGGASGGSASVEKTRQIIKRYQGILRCSPWMSVAYSSRLTTTCSRKSSW